MLHDPIPAGRARQYAACLADAAAGVDVPVRSLWTRTVAGHAALRACVAAKLVPVWRTKTYVQTRDEWWEYEGPEADAAKAAFHAFLEEHVYGLPRDEALALYEAQPSVTDAIDAALEWAGRRATFDEIEAYWRDPAPFEAERDVRRSVFDAAMAGHDAKVRAEQEARWAREEWGLRPDLGDYAAYDAAREEVEAGADSMAAVVGSAGL